MRLRSMSPGPMGTPSEQLALLERARAGDLAALEHLLVEVQPQLYRFSLKMCRHTEDAEDVLQDSMMTLARSFRDFRGASSLSTWMFTIARSFCIKKRRRSKYAPQTEESLEALPAGADQLRTSDLGPEDRAELTEAWEQVHAGIQRLAPDYREVLVLRDIEGLAAREVAEIVGISVSAVKSRLHRARAQLRDLLSEGTYRPAPGCPDIRVVFSKHLEGELSSDICSTMEAHVAECAPCAAECDGLREALTACSSAGCSLPEGVEARVREALRRALATHPPGNNR